MLHVVNWCRIYAIACTVKDAFPPVCINRGVANWCRIGAIHNMLACRGHHLSHDGGGDGDDNGDGGDGDDDDKDNGDDDGDNE